MGSAINLGIQKIREINFAVIWADQIYISNKTISKTLTMHFKKKADLTFPIKKIRKPYTNVIFDIHGKFKDIKQMREQNKKPKIGINDCGFFVCKSKIFKVLLPELIKKNLIRSKKTKEYDFLHSFKFLNNNKIYNVMASKKIETLGINKLKDLKTV